VATDGFDFDAGLHPATSWGGLAITTLVKTPNC